MVYDVYDVYDLQARRVELWVSVSASKESIRVSGERAWREKRQRQNEKKKRKKKKTRERKTCAVGELNPDLILGRDES